ncbi:TPR domain protein/probable lipoprotein [Treponema pallidum subsp. endemicum str. Bosnia A]|uniref:TPR domain protein/probable lipoprotein n=1 Tax=Treponema pallidum subsp. endemicum str. Bosnia A TaxID=1155776 RepID=A0AAU8RQ55_TREPL|nr:tetratricopeptide repeat protein [Treponema pallidum]AJB40948.1 TPR domain protein/probable lipoprotein [Treponema pallidum subsp. endemicum str. Bosnia A]
MSSAVIVFFVVMLALSSIMLVATVASKVGTRSSRRKDKESLMREASRRLAQDPYDIRGLSVLGDIHYQDQEWEKAFAMYATLVERSSSSSQMEQFEILLRYGICGVKTEKYAEAKKGLLLAQGIDSHHFEVNYNLGRVYYLDRQYEQVVPLLRRALTSQPDSAPAAQLLGYTFQKLQKYQEALPYLKKALDLQPEDKETLFVMGECFYEANAHDRALKIFNHLRVDPLVGPRAALYAGTIKTKLNQLEDAAEDFEIGLKHDNIPSDVANELRYRLAQTLIKTQNLGRALVMLREIHQLNPEYRDVTALITYYQELNQNRNLHLYMIAAQSEFIGLCRKVVSKYVPHARVKILDISVLNTHTDIVSEIDTPKWADLVLFRFFRSQGSVGELVLRDLHGRIRELKAGKGICMTAGAFTDEARRFAEGRPMDLYDKNRLTRILNSID